MGRDITTKEITMIGFIAGAAAVAAASVGIVPVADAGDTLAAIQERAQQAIDTRDDSLALAKDRLAANDALTDAHRAELSSRLAEAGDGIDALGTQIAAATTARDAGTDFAAVFTDYRVYAVVIPQAAYTGAADRLTERALPALEEVYERLERLADDDAAAAADLASMREALDAATHLTEGLADEFLAITPATFNNDHTAMADPRGQLRQAAAQLRAAANDARDVVRELR